MFDPTIFENLKVVAEGAIYDLDLAGEITVINRDDCVNLAKMSRTYAISFKKSYSLPHSVSAQLRLFVESRDIFHEIHEKMGMDPGCHLEIRFTMDIREPEKECPSILASILEIWENRPSIEQRLSYVFDKEKPYFQNDILLSFNRRINEEQLDDLPDIILHIVKTVSVLNQLFP